MKKPLLFVSMFLLALSSFASVYPIAVISNPLKSYDDNHINLRIDGSSIISVCGEPIEFEGGLLLRATFVKNESNTMYDLDISSQGLSGVGQNSGKKYQANLKASASGHWSEINDHEKMEFKIRVLLTQQGSGRVVAATLKFFVVLSANGENYNLEPSTFYLDFGDCIPE